MVYKGFEHSSRTLLAIGITCIKGLCSTRGMFLKNGENRVRLLINKILKIHLRKEFSPQFIDFIHKWRPIYYSFIFMLISLPSLVSMCKIQKNVCSKLRLRRLISMNIKE